MHTTNADHSAADPGDDALPVRCDLAAIPADQLEAHVAFARTRLFGTPGASREIDGGYAFTLPAERYADVATFVGNERLCCAHLHFVLVVPPRGRAIELRVTGPMARDELESLLSRPATHAERPAPNRR